MLPSAVCAPCHCLSAGWAIHLRFLGTLSQPPWRNFPMTHQVSLSPHVPATVVPMYRDNILWATFFGGSCLFFGTCALFGYFPGEKIGVRMFAQLAERFGAIETGLGTIMVGVILVIWILLSRPGVATDGGIGCDGGSDGGD